MITISIKSFDTIQFIDYTSHSFINCVLNINFPYFMINGRSKTIHTIYNVIFLLLYTIQRILYLIYKLFSIMTAVMFSNSLTLLERTTNKKCI